MVSNFMDDSRNITFCCQEDNGVIRAFERCCDFSRIICKIMLASPGCGSLY